jgi:endonuclease YncB( thermonuclease family)
VIRAGRNVTLALAVDGRKWHNKDFAGEQWASARLLYAKVEADARSQRHGLWSDPNAIAP